MIDSHCHLDFEDFDLDRERVLEHCQQQGITRILVPGISTSRIPHQRELQQRQRHLRHTNRKAVSIDLAFGLHPYFLPENIDAHITQLSEHVSALRADVVAIGETGLDGAIKELVPWERQIQSLQAHIDLANSYELPLILHHRQSHNELIRELKRAKFQQGGIVHAFSGSAQVAKQYMDMGFYLGVGGTITYERAKKTRNTFTQLPLDVLLLETDAPDMPMQGKQGQRNSPEYLGTVLSCIAHLQQKTEDDVLQQTTENYHRLFPMRE